MTMQRRELLAALAAAAVLPAGRARAEAYPARPVKLVVPFAPGGNIDLTARTLATGMAGPLGQPVVVENKPGAGGMLGAESVAKAEADGYTLLLASTGSLAAAPTLYAKLNFDPVKDFVPAPAITRVPLVLVVRPTLAVKDVAELVALARTRPGALTMASAGNGTSNHLTGELFQRMAGVKFVHVPYRGSSQALNDLLGGQVDLMFDNVPSSMPFLQSGRLKALAVTSDRRSVALPALATVAEGGLAGFEASTTTGVMLPAGTPPAVQQRVSAAVTEALRDPALRRSFEQVGADLAELDAAGFGVLMRSESAKWGRVVQDAAVRLE